jgi:hypothetical protein
MEFKISENIINSVLAYLATRPYQEVANLINAIHQDVEPIVEIIHEDGKEIQLD